MKVFRILRNYFFYCGLEKDDYNALKKDAYISNFIIWRVLHIFMAVIFGGLFAASLLSPLLESNIRVLAVDPGYLTVALDSTPCFSSSFLALGFSVFICTMESSTMQISPH